MQVKETSFVTQFVANTCMQAFSHGNEVQIFKRLKFMPAQIKYCLLINLNFLSACKNQNDS